MNYCYFLLDHPPVAMPPKLWFAIWSEDKSRLEWTAEQPSVRDPSAPWTVGVNLQADDVPLPGATLLAKFTSGIKDVPPPPILQATDVSIKGFRAAFEESFEATAAKTAVLP